MISFFKKSPWRGAVIIGTIVLTATLLGEREVARRFSAQNDAEAVKRLSAVQDRLQYAVDRRIFLGSGLVSYVVSNPDISKATFLALATGIGNGDPAIRSVQLARNSIVSHVWPLKGNEAAFGLRLLDLPDQAGAVKRTIKTGKTLVAGPVNLVQGGTGFVSRTPIFLSSKDNSSEKGSYWGLATIIIDTERLFKETGLLDGHEGIELAIRGKDGQGAEGAVFLGKASLFDMNPLTSEVRLPQGSWQIGAIATSGGASEKLSKGLVLFWGMVVSLLSGLLAWKLLREPMRLKQEITERKKAERDTERALTMAEDLRYEAEGASRAKSEFLANMSHEIRTPLGGIVGNVELLLNTKLTTEQQRCFRAIEASSESLLSLVNSVLDLSKIEAGRFELEKISFRLRELVDKIVNSLSVAAHAKGVELICQVSPLLPAAAIGDPTRLGQIIRNLVGNAVKFTERGEILVRVEPEEQSTDEILLHFSVRDTGIGIALDAQEKIFATFEQADGSTTRKYGGTGLGLAICSQLVHMMRGKIWVDSEVGIGSTFHFLVRMGVEEAHSMTASTGDLVHLKELSALVVDDNATARSALANILSSWGMNLTTAASGREALATMGQARHGGRAFDLVLVDEMMPEMDGDALVQCITEKFRLDSPPIVVLTSPGTPGNMSECTSQLIAGYVTKPVIESDLLSVITRALRGDPEDRRDIHDRKLESERHLTILLAEDNEINRLVVVNMLESMGHRVVSAQNGRQAVSEFSKQQFDVILMDIQMPGMDGIEATKSIRQLEEDRGKHVPIVALTAHAMKGDRERLLTHGMDEYLTKPVKSEHLLAVVNSSVRERAGSGAMVAPLMEQDVLDKNQLLNQLYGDRDLLEEATHLFLEEFPRILSTLDEAIGRGDAREVSLTAHKVKGSAATLCGCKAMNAAHRLEVIAASGNLKEAVEARNELQLELEHLGAALKSFVGKGRT